MASEFEKFLKKLCPQGVDYKPLGEVCEMKRGTAITKKDVTEGEIPVIAGGQKPAYYCDKANRTGETITVAGSGAYAGYVAYWETPIFVSDAFSVKGNDSIKTKYVYYVLKNMQETIYGTKKGGGVPHVHISSIEGFELPLPPLAVQEEIVRILDAFTELEARKKQYAYYRDTLLSFSKDDPNVQWKTLGEVGTFTRGNGLQKKDFTEEGIGCIHYGQIYTRFGTATDKTLSRCSPDLAKRLKKAHKGDLVIATTSENVEDVCKAVLWMGEEEICIGGHSCVYSHDQDPKYIAYFLQTTAFFNQKRKCASGVKVIDIKISDLEKFTIPLPPLAVQREIAATLDKFEALTSDLQSGLPAEIEARRKQYEHYRDRLLTFPRRER